MKRFILTVFLSLVWCGSGVAAEITGRTIVLKGDVIKIDGQIIHLQGIDAPETYQICYHANGADYLCGDESHLYLLDFISQKQVYCTYERLDDQDRPVATCFVGKANINRAMVQAGWALPEQNDKTYELERIAAKKAKRGMWGGKFCAPRLVRSQECVRE